MKSSNTLAEKCIHYGVDSLNDVEILNLMLNLNCGSRDHSTLSKKLIQEFGSLSGVIDSARIQPQDLPKAAERYAFGLKIPYLIADRYLKEKIINTPVMKSSEDVHRYLSNSMRGLKIEQFRVLYLNGRNHFINDEVISTGTINSATVYPREIVRAALRNHAAALILAHNHPSGNPEPSRDDIMITDKIKNASTLFDIAVHDHIIIAGNQYTSFADRGLI